jgi:hypothetical protein
MKIKCLSHINFELLSTPLKADFNYLNYPKLFDRALEAETPAFFV